MEKKRTPTQQSWKAMRERCNNPKSTNYSGYGAKGITVCSRWNRFEQFLADMGERPPGTTLDRKDSKGNYEPNNCRWATAAEQSENRSCTRRIEYRGETLLLTEWATRLGMDYRQLLKRVHAGWNAERMFTTPLGRNFRCIKALMHKNK